jgi:hypothetical protein
MTILLRQLSDGLFDTRRQLGDRGDEAFKDANQRADDLAPGLGFGVTGETSGSRAQAGQQVCGRMTPTVSVLDQLARRFSPRRLALSGVG